MWGLSTGLRVLVENSWKCEYYHNTYAGDKFGNVSAIGYNTLIPTTKGK